MDQLDDKKTEKKKTKGWGKNSGIEEGGLSHGSATSI